MISIQIEKDTPREVMDASARFILELKDLLHGDPRQAELLVRSPAEVIKEAKERTAAAIDDEDTPSEVEEDKGQPDVNGVYWDERIHSANATKLPDGAWRKKRGVSENLYNQVLAEQRNAGTQTDIEDAIEEASEPPLPVTPEMFAPAAPEAPTATERSFSELLQLVTQKITENPTIAPKIQEAVSAAGYSAIPLLKDETPENIGAVYAVVEQVA